jgi:predicted nuclease with TOPRIM domain
MSYDYQTDDMDALRITFEDMMFDIESLKDSLDDADEAIMELYHEANDLEAELDRLRAHHHQVVFDMEEDYIELERKYNALARDFNEMFDELNPIPDFDEDEDQWELMFATNVTFNKDFT